MTNKLIALVLSFCMAMSIAAVAYAQEQSAQPGLARNYVNYPSAADSSARWRINIEPIRGEGNYSPYYWEATATDIKVYTSETGSVQADPQELSVTPVVTPHSGGASGTPTSVLNAIDVEKHGNPANNVTYYIAITESGKEESARTPFTVRPASALGSAEEAVRSGIFPCGPDNAPVTPEAAKAELTAKIKALPAYDPSITVTVEGNDFRLAKYGVSGALIADVTLTDGTKQVTVKNVQLSILSHEYTGNKLFEIDPGEEAAISFLRGDTAAQTVGLPVYGTIKLYNSSSPFTSNYEFSLSESAASAMPALAGVTAGIHSGFSDILPITVSVPQSDIDKTVYLWCNAPGETAKLVGSFRLSVNVYAERSVQPALGLDEVAMSMNMALPLSNADSLRNAEFMLYLDVSSYDNPGPTYEVVSAARFTLRGDRLLVQPNTVFAGGNVLGFGIAALQSGKAASEMDLFEAIVEPYNGLVITGAYIKVGGDSTIPPDVTVQGAIKKNAGYDPASPTGVTIIELNSDSEEFTALLAAGADATGDVAAAYEIGLDNAAIDGEMELSFYVGLEKAGQWVLVLHKNSVSGETDTYRRQVQSNGCVSVNVASMSPFMVKEGASSPAHAAGSYFSLRPVITRQPVNIAAGVGGVALLEVKANGTGLRYQWQVERGLGWANIPGATLPVYTVNPVAASDGGRYRCVITNDYGSTASGTVYITVQSHVEMPQTGDGDTAGLYAGLILLGIGILVLAGNARKRRVR